MNVRTIALAAVALLSVLHISSTQANTEVIGNLSGDVSASHGSLSYELPLATPASIHGLNPALALTYHQRSGVSIVGSGFSLQASSSISRCSPTVAKEGFSAGIELSANARFCHGGKKLVAVAGVNGASGSEYRQFEDNNSKYIAHGGNNHTPAYWLHYSSDGYIYRYERIGLAADLFTHWLLVKKQDQFGNAIHYQYSHAAVPVLENIQYPGYQVNFVYEQRANPLSQYQQGVKATLDKRLASIKVFADSVQSYEYRFDYEFLDHIVASERLASVTRCFGADGDDGCLKPVTFDYLAQPDSGQALDRNADKTVVIPRAFYADDSALKNTGFAYRPSIASGDLNRDGFSDFCYYKPGTGVLCTLHDGANGYGSITPWSEDLAYIADTDDYKYYSTVYLVDLNTDGYTDYCLADSVGLRCGLNNGGQGFAAASYWSRVDNGGIGHEDFPRFSKVNDDNRIDLCGISSEGFYRCFENDGSRFNASLLQIDNVDIRRTLPVDDIEVSLPNPEWIDVDGDLDLDICWINLSGELQCRMGSANPVNHVTEYGPVQTVGVFDIPVMPELEAPELDVDYSEYHTELTAYEEAYKEYGENLRLLGLSLRQGDINGDGLLDVCYVKAANYQCHINTGNGYSGPQNWLNIQHLLDNEDRIHATLTSITLSDRNLDGLGDFCAIYEGYQHCGYNQVNHFAAPIPRQVINTDFDMDLTVVKAYKNFVRRWQADKTEFRFITVNAAYGRPTAVSDVNHDGFTDTCYRSIDGVVCVTNDNFAPSTLLTGVTDSFGQRTDIDYQNLLGTGRYQAATHVPDGFYEVPPNRQVVASITTDSGAYSDGVAIRNTLSYRYQGFMVNPVTGVSGFMAVEWHNAERDTKTRSHYYLERHLEGQEKHIEEYVAGALVKEKTNQFAVSPQSNGTIRLVLNSTRTQQNDLSGNVLVTEQTTNTQFDSYGYPQAIISVKQQEGESLSVVTQTTYEHDTGSWILGRPSSQVVGHYDQTGRSIEREVSFQYDNGSLIKQVIEPSSPLAQTIEYAYDAAGNTRLVSTSGSGMTRAVEKTFDAQGRVLTETNALGQRVIFTYHARCGGVETQTDIAGRVSRQYYDAQCRVYKEQGPDSNETTREYLWADASDNDWIHQAGNYPVGYTNPIVYKVKESSAAGPWTLNYYDAQGRVVKTAALGYSDAANQRQSESLAVYDRYGRKTATTRPFYRTNGYVTSPSWITVEYDHQGRLKHETKIGPQGMPVVSSFNYDRSTTTLTFADHQKQTVNGIHGKPRYIIENGLRIDYTYDPLGNLLSTETGGLVTQLSYDERGNKISQDDPSMGVWHYQYNAFGELIEQRDAKLQITHFTYDNLGRKSQRDSLEGTTTWHYLNSGSGIGQLEREVGPSATKTWSYNALGLVATETLTVADKTFTTRFDYDSFSRLITKTEPNGLPIHYDYDLTGAVDSVSIPQEDFKDFNYEIIEQEYVALLTLLVQTESKIINLETQADYHFNQALAYAAKVRYFSGLLEEVNRQIQNLQDTADQHREMAERYMEMARIERENAAALRAQFGDKVFTYKGIDNGKYRFRYKRCTKKKRSWGGIGPKKCKRHEEHNVYVEAGELNPVDVNAGLVDRSVKHYAEEEKTIDLGALFRAYGLNTTGFETTFTYMARPSRKIKPYEIYETTARAWDALAQAELAAAQAAMDDINKVNNTQVLMPVEVVRDTWVPIAGDITFFIKTPVTFVENQLVSMTLQEAANYYQQKVNEYENLAKQSLARYQALIDGTTGVKGLDELRADLTEIKQSQVHFENSLLNMGIDVADLALANSTQASLTAANGRLNIWMATMRRPDGMLERELFGNGLRTVRSFNSGSGLLERITTSAYSGTVLRDIEYRYNARGLISEKLDALTEAYQTEERFDYDSQGRLIDWHYDQALQTNDSTQHNSLSRVYAYDDRGNMTFKTGAGEMSYDAATNRLTSRTIDSQNHLYGYDENGNMQEGDGRTYDWTAFNKVRQIYANGQTVNFDYDASHRRVRKETESETTYYVSQGYEFVVRKGVNGQAPETIHRHHVWNGNDVVATYEKRDPDANANDIDHALQTDQVAYYHRDIIGSGEVVTGSDMEVLSRRFYTPYGELIQDLLPVSEAPSDEATTVVVEEREVQIDEDLDYKALIETTINKPEAFSLLSENMLANVGFDGALRGYTSHESIPEVGLINMNARLYDPVIGRFISADSIVPDITRPLSYNRYSYVEGNPVLARDPSGHFIQVVGLVAAAFVLAHDTDNETAQMVTTIALAAVATYALGPEGVFQVMAAAATVSVGVTYLKKGSLNSEDWRNAAWSAVAAGAASYVGGIDFTGDFGWVKQAALHSVTQGGISALRGDGFAQGAVSGLASSLAGSTMEGLGFDSRGAEHVVGRTLVASGFGYLASEATGGDGVQGAITGAIVHLFNHEALGAGKGDGGLAGKFKRWLSNTSEKNKIIDELFFAEDSPLTVEGLLKNGNYKFGVDQTGDAYAKYSVSSGIYSVSGNIDKDGNLFGVSVSVGTAVKLSGAELGLKVDLGKVVPYTARQFNDFISSNSGLSGNAYRALQNRGAVIDEAVRGATR